MYNIVFNKNLFPLHLNVLNQISTNLRINAVKYK